jgi:hypothetical protein
MDTPMLHQSERTILANGRLDSVVAENVRFTYGYDMKGRQQNLSTATLSGSTATPVAAGFMTRGYDAADRLERITYGEADSVAVTSRDYLNGWQYGFDAAGRRSAVVSLGTALTTTNGPAGNTATMGAARSAVPTAWIRPRAPSRRGPHTPMMASATG